MHGHLPGYKNSPRGNNIGSERASALLRERSWQSLALGGALVVYLIYRLTCSWADPDLWGYLAFGQLFWRGEGFPYRDIFAYAPTKEIWVYHEWLTGVVFYPVYRLLGAPGLQLLKYCLGLLTAGLIYLTARRKGGEPLVSAIALFLAGVAFSVGYSPVRAQLFTYLFWALSIFLLETARQEERFARLWWLVPIQIAWANLHGGFVAGMGLIGLYAAGQVLTRRKFWPYLAVLAAAAAATLINPYGLKYWTYLADAIAMPRPEITEWQPISQAYREGELLSRHGYFLVMIFLAVIFSLWYRLRDLTAALVLLTTLYLGVKHVRHQVFFLWSFGVYFPVMLTAFIGRLRSDEKFMRLLPRIGRKLPLLVVAGVTMWWLYGAATQHPLSLIPRPGPDKKNKSAVYYPLGALNYIREHNLSGNLLPRFEWGEYIIWTLYPKCRVGMDGRYETVYPHGYCREYFAFIFARPGWRDFLRGYPHDMILIQAGSKTRQLMKDEADWQEVYSDEGCVLFRKKVKESCPCLSGLDPPAGDGRG